MSVLPAALHHPVSFNNCNITSIPILTSKSLLKFGSSTLAQTLSRTNHNLNSVYAVKDVSVSHAFKKNQGDFCDQRNETLHLFKRWFEFIRDIFPGGNWWNLRDIEQYIDGSPIEMKPMTVLNALSEMFTLIADEKWILFVAFGALTVATTTEISMPGILAESVFSAQNGEMLVLYNNSRLLFFLCCTSGICSGLRSGCFAIANMILVKRLRETVYSSLLFQKQ